MKRLHKICVTLGILLFFCYSYIHQKNFDSPTPASRLNLLHAVFTEQRLEIDRYHQNTPDKAKYREHYFSDKAPGTVAVALPAFSIGVVLLWISGIPLDSKTGWLISSWVSCAGSLGILTAVGGVFLFDWLRKWVPQRFALATTLALFLGAAPFPYATMMFSHALVIGLLACSLWVIDLMANKSSATETGFWRKECVAGFACGLALASEFSAGIIIIGLVAWLVLFKRITPLWFWVAAAFPLLLVPGYNIACFGDPFTLAYSYQASFPEMREGLFAIKWPSLETAFNLLFTPMRGLFFWTPFLTMVGFGCWPLFKRSQLIFWLTYLIPLIHVVVISGRSWDWPAGPTLGPRFLAPILPLLALPCALGVQKLPKLGLALAAYSILITSLATLTDACPGFNHCPNPLIDLHIPLFLKGEFSPNLGMALGLPPYLSVALFYAILIGGISWLWKQLPSETGVRDATNSSR